VGDIRHCYADLHISCRELGYSPQVSLEDGIADLLAWVQTQAVVDHYERARREMLVRGLM
jgi:dTDP-L-rhamnose 4-epimerase